MLKTDWVTKLLLAEILFFLAVLALKPSAPVVAPAWAQGGSSGSVAAAGAGQGGFVIIAKPNKYVVITPNKAPSVSEW